MELPGKGNPTTVTKYLKVPENRGMKTDTSLQASNHSPMPTNVSMTGKETSTMHGDYLGDVLSLSDNGGQQAQEREMPTDRYSVFNCWSQIFWAQGRTGVSKIKPDASLLSFYGQ